jgi:hypothetical protein
MTTTYPSQSERIAILSTPERVAARASRNTALDAIELIIEEAVTLTLTGLAHDHLLADAVAIADAEAPGCHESHVAIVDRLYSRRLNSARQATL